MVFLSGIFGLIWTVTYGLDYLLELTSPPKDRYAFLIRDISVDNEVCQSDIFQENSSFQCDFSLSHLCGYSLQPGPYAWIRAMKHEEGRAIIPKHDISERPLYNIYLFIFV